jgi:hypothetical protein
VVVRVLPIGKNESAHRALRVESPTQLVLVPPLAQSEPSPPLHADAILDESATQAELFAAVGEPAVRAALEGCDYTVIVHGQSGTGRTHSLFGTAAQPGIARSALASLYRALQEQRAGGWSVSGSFLELRGEKLRDLLNPSARKLRLRAGARDPQQGEREGAGLVVHNLTEHAAAQEADAVRLIDGGLHERTKGGAGARTAVHAIFTLTVRGGDGVRIGTIRFVELSASERVRFDANLAGFCAALRATAAAALRPTAATTSADVNTARVAADSAAADASARLTSTSSPQRFGRSSVEWLLRPRRTSAESAASSDSRRSCESLASCESSTGNAAEPSPTAAFNADAWAGARPGGRTPSSPALPALYRLLRECVCGAASTTLLFTVSPAALDADESVRTLSLASAARRVVRSPPQPSQQPAIDRTEASCCTLHGASTLQRDAVALDQQRSLEQKEMGTESRPNEGELSHRTTSAVPTADSASAPRPARALAKKRVQLTADTELIPSVSEVVELLDEQEKLELELSHAHTRREVAQLEVSLLQEELQSVRQRAGAVRSERTPLPSPSDAPASSSAQTRPLLKAKSHPLSRAQMDARVELAAKRTSPRTGAEGLGALSTADTALSSARDMHAGGSPPQPASNVDVAQASPAAAAAGSNSAERATAGVAVPAGSDEPVGWQVRSPTAVTLSPSVDAVMADDVVATELSTLFALPDYACSFKRPSRRRERPADQVRRQDEPELSIGEGGTFGIVLRRAPTIDQFDFERADSQELLQAILLPDTPITNTGRLSVIIDGSVAVTHRPHRTM